jgi:hypothetical protein
LVFLTEKKGNAAPQRSGFAGQQAILRLNYFEKFAGKMLEIQIFLLYLSVNEVYCR